MEHYVMLKSGSIDRTEMREWLNEQFGLGTDCFPLPGEGQPHVGVWYEVHGGFAFKNEKDALWFKLRWI